MIIVYIVL